MYVLKDRKQNDGGTWKKKHGASKLTFTLRIHQMTNFSNVINCKHYLLTELMLPIIHALSFS